MGYVLRVRLASFFAGAATTSLLGLYLLHDDYKIALHSISHQSQTLRQGLKKSSATINIGNQWSCKMKELHGSLEERISTLEKLKEVEASKSAEASE